MTREQYENGFIEWEDEIHFDQAVGFITKPQPPEEHVETPEQVRERIAAANTLANALNAMDRTSRLLEDNEDELIQEAVTDLNVSAWEIEQLLGSEEE